MRSKEWWCAASAVIVVLLASCARTVVDTPILSNPEALEDEIVFWEELETRRVVTNDDALHALLIFAGEGAGATEYRHRAEIAGARGWIGIPPPPADESVTIGTVAVAVCDILGIRGGLTMSVFGPSPRYATRELVFLGYLPRRSANESLSGLEFIDLMGRIEEHGEGDQERTGS